jgi:hypothetical protein
MEVQQVDEYNMCFTCQIHFDVVQPLKMMHV